MIEGRVNFVYRAYDRNGALLYVGVTRNLSARYKWHRSASRWFADMASVRVTGPLMRNEAVDLERLLILKAGPIHNKQRALPRRSAWDKWGDVLAGELGRIARKVAA